MKKGERRLFAIVLVVLALAAAALAAHRVGLGGAPRVLRVSVLLDGTADEYWKNFQAGLNQAALDQNVDLRFVTYHEEDTAQSDALRREWAGETDGVVLVPADGGALAETLRDAPSGFVVCAAGAQQSGADACVAPDPAQIAQRLANAAEAVDGGTYTLCLSASPVPAAREAAQALEEELAGRGAALRRVTAAPERLPDLGDGALLAVEPAVTEALCALPEAEGRICGVGVSGRILRGLEDGKLAALVVQSGYDAGYLALSQVTDRLAGRPARSVTLDSYTATRENMLCDPMINILFASYSNR